MLQTGRFSTTNKPASHKYNVIKSIKGSTEIFFFWSSKKNSKIYVYEQRDKNSQDNSEEKNYT